MIPKATLKAPYNSGSTVGALLMLAAAFLFAVLDGLIQASRSTFPSVGYSLLSIRLWPGHFTTSFGLEG